MRVSYCDEGFYVDLDQCVSGDDGEDLCAEIDVDDINQELRRLEKALEELEQNLAEKDDLIQHLAEMGEDK